MELLCLVMLKEKNIPFTVNYTLPPNWDIVYGLDPQIGTKNGFIAKDYDELVDAPIMCGKFQRIDFNVKIFHIQLP